MIRLPTLDEFGTAPDLAAARLLTLAATAAVAYLAALALAHLAAGALRIPRLTRLLLPLTPRILVALIPATLSALPASAQDLPLVTMHLLDEPGPAAAAPTTTTTTIPTPNATVAPTTAASAWTVRTGEHFWNKAAHLAAQHLGRAPTNREIVRYWLPLIEANRTELEDPGNANLIYPGQQFEVPPPG